MKLNALLQVCVCVLPKGAHVSDCNGVTTGNGMGSGCCRSELVQENRDGLGGFRTEVISFFFEEGSETSLSVRLGRIRLVSSPPDLKDVHDNSVDGYNDKSNQKEDDTHQDRCVG